MATPSDMIQSITDHAGHLAASLGLLEGALKEARDEAKTLPAIQAKVKETEAKLADAQAKLADTQAQLEKAQAAKARALKELGVG